MIPKQKSSRSEGAPSAPSARFPAKGVVFGVLAWHFSRGPLPGVLRDGRPVVIGEMLVHDGPIALCESGLHASVNVTDALHYAPGEILHRVTLGGRMLTDTDKIVARERTVLWSLDAREIVRAHGRWCALSVAHLWDMPEVVREYLESGDETKRKAAWKAASDATWDATWDAARAAAWDAAIYAASNTAGDAGFYGARAAQEAALATMYAASDAATALPNACTRFASDAASDAACAHATARAAQEADLYARVMDAHID